MFTNLRLQLNAQLCRMNYLVNLANHIKHKNIEVRFFI